jgi:hypothetical protein
MPGGPVGRHLNFTSRQVAEQASLNATTRLKVRTGRLARGYRVEVETGVPEGFRFWVTNTTTGQDPKRSMSYAEVQERGSGEHGPSGSSYIIRPRPPKKNLVFYVDGKKVVTSSVRHPGVKPQNLLRDALITVMARRQ